MVVRASWYARLMDTRLSVLRTATQLVSTTSRGPVDLTELGVNLGVRIKTYPKSSKRQGGLSRDDGGWIIWIADSIPCSDEDQRFILAHELAHLLFLHKGVRAPIGEEEYWILESACDRVAVELLVPAAVIPYDLGGIEDVAAWHLQLMAAWNVSSSTAVASICAHARNVLSAAIVTLVDSSRGVVEWSTGQDVVLDWPLASDAIDDREFSSMHDFLKSMADASQELTLVEKSTGVLVGFELADRIVIYFLSQVPEEERLFYLVTDSCV